MLSSIRPCNKMCRIYQTGVSNQLLKLNLREFNGNLITTQHTFHHFFFRTIKEKYHMRFSSNLHNEKCFIKLKNTSNNLHEIIYMKLFISSKTVFCHDNLLCSFIDIVICKDIQYRGCGKFIVN